MMKLKNAHAEESSLIKLLDMLVNKVMSFSKKVDNIKGFRIEIVLLAVYLLIQCLMIYFHEPWFDEAQAWDIARDGNLKEILFVVPHYEGHPALWHLILMPFAKLGLDFNISISMVNVFFVGAAVAFILFKSPFPRIVRAILPFTYFLGYQYSVVSRPYSMMALAFVLLAMTYGKRDNNPIKYVGCLVFLCATSAYGIVLAGALAIVWLIEILKQDKLSQLFKDKRCWWLFILLAYAVFILLRIIPYDDTWAMSVVTTNEGIRLVARLVYMLFALPSELFFTSTYVSDYLAGLPISELIIDSVIGITILMLTIICARRKKMTLTFVVPYLFFGVFCAKVYIYVHHTGIAFLLFVFWWWIFIDKDAGEKSKAIAPVIKNGILRKFAVVFTTLGLCITVIWTLVAYVNEVRYEYMFGKNEASFLKEHNLTDNSVVIEWEGEMDFLNTENAYYDLKHVGKLVTISPYNAVNNCVNWPMDYSLFTKYHKNATEEENEIILQSLLNNIEPDVIIGNPKWETLLLADEDAELMDGLFIEKYALVYCEDIHKIWKMNSVFNKSYIYVKRSLLEEKNLTEVSMLSKK